MQDYNMRSESMKMINTSKENRKNIYAYLLPACSILFFLIFIVCAHITKQEVGAISSYWSIIASIVS